MCFDGGHAEDQECRAGFPDDAFFTDGERGSLEPLISPGTENATCENWIVLWHVMNGVRYPGIDLTPETA